MELSNNPAEPHALIYALLARVDALEACVHEMKKFRGKRVRGGE